MPSFATSRDDRAGPPARGPSAWLVPAALSGVAGWVDTVGFIALVGLFTAHVTGNFVVIGLAIAGRTGAHDGLLAKLLALPVFVLGVAATTILVRRRERRGRSARRHVVLVEAALLAGFLACGTAAGRVVDADAPWPMAAAFCAVLAMGVQNAAGRLVFAAASPTTVMTVNVTQAVIDAVDLVRMRCGGQAVDASWQRLRRLVPPVVAFAVGAFAGALSWRAFGFACVGVPIAMLLAVAAFADDG